LADVSDPNWLGSDDIAIEPQTVDPREFLRAVVGAFRPAAHDKGLELFLDLPPDAPAQICLDPARLRLALTNLISNAIRFTTTGGVRVRFQVQPATRPGWVRLGFIVADTGSGMSRSQLALLFARAGEGRAGKGHDSDAHIGLAITKRLARNLGAKLSAKSELGAGSVFTLTLEAPVSAGRAQSPGVRPSQGKTAA
jgi:signal transduction histidine kinase